MDFELTKKIKAELEPIETPWGTLLGVKADRITRTIAADSQYEWAETAIVGQLLRAGSVAIDVGANIGYYTALFARLVGPKGAVHAFEANPFTAAILSLAKAQNGWSSATVNSLALGDRAGVLHVKAMDLPAVLHDPKLNLGGWSLRDTIGGEWEVQVVTLDQYVRDHKIEKVHLLKVDVEGFELKVIHGADLVLRKFHPDLVMEMRAGNDVERLRCQQMIEFLTGRDYVCCRIVKRPFPHFRTIGRSDFDDDKYHFSLLALRTARYQEFEASINWRPEPLGVSMRAVPRLPAATLA
jgi:FkbM family methyltransferase